MPKLLVLLAATGALLGLAAPAFARDSLGIFGNWGAFRDPAVPRCYAIARAEAGRQGRGSAYADIASWPRRGLRGVVHFRLSRATAPAARMALAIGDRRIPLIGTGSDAWLADPRLNDAVISAIRVQPAMSIAARDVAHHPFVDKWLLAGAASAVDSAALRCAAHRG